MIRPNAAPLHIGDVLKVRRFFYAHYAVAVGPDVVLEFAGDRAKDLTTARVRLTLLSDFAAGESIEVASRGVPGHEDDVLERAFAVLNRRDYSLFERNCEHVAWYVSTGRWRSTQVSAVGWILVGGLLARLLLWTDEEEKDVAEPA